LIVDGNPLTLDVGAPIQNGTVMMLRNTLRGGVTGFSSDRAIAAKANVVIDLDAQGYDLGESPRHRQIWIGGLGVLPAAPPPTVNLGAGGDYGYDEAHDIGAS
jgi:hypothetical protein